MYACFVMLDRFLMLLSFHTCYCYDCAGIVLLAVVHLCLFRLASTQHLQLQPWMCDLAYFSVDLVNIATMGLRRCVRVVHTVHHSDGPQLALMLAYPAIFVRMAQACFLLPIIVDQDRPTALKAHRRL